MSSPLSRRALIVGLGRSGLAAARLAEHGGSEVWVTDLRPESALAGIIDQLPAGTRSFFGEHPTGCLDGVDLVITSPGVPADAPLLEAARQRRVRVLTELEYAWCHRRQAPLVAVTGSNGKSTVTVLIAEMLRAGGLAAIEGGNLGPPASELVLQPGWQSWVLEVSSFQAELLSELRPRVGLLLNLSQDHLERHPDLDSYLAAKQRLFKFQTADDLAVLNADEPAVAATAGNGRRRLFSLTGAADAQLEGERLVLGDQVLLAADQVALSGRHNLANALAAALAALDLGVAPAAIAATLQSFDGLAHRHRTVLEAAGVRWVNDSKATNVGATLAGLSGYPAGTVHLILGGLGKGQDFSLLAGEVLRAGARIYLIGADAGVIGAALADTVPCQDCGTLEEAIGRAAEHAEPGQTVLLAPACASFDQFSSYGERGDVFAALVRDRAGAQPCR